MGHKQLTTIVGLGKTGYSCVQHLTKLGYNLAVVDSRPNPPYLEKLRSNFPQIPFGDFTSELVTSAKKLIVSPGVAPSIAQRGQTIMGDIELFARAVTAPVVAITGSNGKSTVTALVAEMAQTAGLKVKIGGNFGTPALDLLDESCELYVLELSSFQLETTYSLEPVAATVLNISPDHMDRYPNLESYIAAKQRIFHHAKCAIINYDDPVSFANASLPKKVIKFSLTPANSDLQLAPIELKIKGQHQVANALAALALGTAINLPMEAMLTTLRTFPGLPHRCQWIGTSNGADWYNDSKGTNVGATKAAIEGLGTTIAGKLIVIAGGIGKDADFTSLRKPFSNYVKLLILIGRDAIIIAQAVKGACRIEYAASMQQAVQLAYEAAGAQDAVILSPACASFDMFDNFEQRGAVFIEEFRGYNHDQ